MQPQRGFVYVIGVIGILLNLVILGTATYYTLRQHNAPNGEFGQVTTLSQNIDDLLQERAIHNNTPSASVDTLAPAGETPEFILTGTATNTEVVHVRIRAITPAKATGYTSLYTQENIPVIDGHWWLKFSAYSLAGFSPPYNIQVDTTVSDNIQMLTSKDLSITFPPTISANVVSGTAPLTVIFTVGFLGLGNYWVEFGDGTRADTTCAQWKPETDACLKMDTITHTYSAPGTYTATYIDPHESNRVTGSVTISVK